jgi:hypothetical protein
VYPEIRTWKQVSDFFVVSTHEDLILQATKTKNNKSKSISPKNDLNRVKGKKSRGRSGVASQREDFELTYDVAKYVDTVFDPVCSPPGAKTPHVSLGVDALTESVKLNRSIPIVTNPLGQCVVFVTARPEKGVYYSTGLPAGTNSGQGIYTLAQGAAPYLFTEQSYLMSLASAQHWASQKDIDSIKANYASIRTVAAGGIFKPSVSAVQNQGNVYCMSSTNRTFGVFEGPPNAADTYALTDVLCSTTIRNGLKTVAIPIQEGVKFNLVPLDGAESYSATRIVRWTDNNASSAPVNFIGAPGPAGNAIRALGAYALGNGGGSIWLDPVSFTFWNQEQYTHFTTMAIIFEGCLPSTNIGNFELSMHLECVSVDKGTDRSQPSASPPHPFTFPAAKEVMQNLPQARPATEDEGAQRQVIRAGASTGQFFSPIVDLARNTVMSFAKKLMPF